MVGERAWYYHPFDPGERRSGAERRVVLGGARVYDRLGE